MTKYKLIESLKGEFKVLRMAKTLKINKSSYYRFLRNPEGIRSHQDNILKLEIKKIFYFHKKRYGSRRIKSELNDSGYICGIKRVTRLMKIQGLVAKAKKKFKITTDSKHTLPIAPNLLKRNFKPKHINKIWTSDITYIRTKTGWLYLCIILDLCSRKVVGWSMANHMKSAIVINSLNMAYQARKPGEGLIFHSDRGVQYACLEFRLLLNKYKIKQSMSRKGNCWDNAPTESFFHSLKIEEIYGEKYENQEAAKNKIFEYLEIYYNKKRKHSFLNNVSPDYFERKYLNKTYERTA